MFKVGDEVLIKGEVVEVMDAVPYPTKVKLGKGEDAYLFSNDEICFLDKIVKTYADGLNDAWELAKKMARMEFSDLKKIFGHDYFPSLLVNYTYEEALAKIEAYEKEKSVCVGDVVIDNDGVKACVLEQTTTDHFFVFTETGSVEDWSENTFKKTGKHIDIESLLKQIGE